MGRSIAVRGLVTVRAGMQEADSCACPKAPCLCPCGEGDLRGCSETEQWASLLQLLRAVPLLVQLERISRSQ